MRTHATRAAMYEMGCRGIELLLAILDAQQTAIIQERLPASLVVRATTGPPIAEG
jgi:DNA-binding LacI/PurR family transcriptional regulator